MSEYRLPDSDMWYWADHASRRNTWHATALNRKVLEQLAPDAANLTVLDAGSGAGDNAIAFAADNRVREVWAIDAVPAVADVMYARVADIGGPAEDKILFLPQALENIARGSLPRVNVVFASAVLPYVHTDKLADVSAMLMDTVEEGGLFAANFAAPDSIANRIGSGPAISAVSKELVEEWLRDFGFDGAIEEIGFNGDIAQSDEPVLMYQVVARRRRLQGPKR